MNTRIIPLRTTLCGLLACAWLAACGGGSSGGGGSPPSPPPPPPPPPLPAGQVKTSEGIYEGNFEGNLLVFRGIRFAAAPVGDLRFKAPEPPAAFAGVAAADAFGAACAQPGWAGVVGEEDCLFLNIWAHTDETQRPVIVYMHPGGANGVGGQMTSIDGAALAESGDVVVVNFNRRIGPLGYLAIDELIQENPRNTAGNYAVLDAIAALEWVQANIAEFGGDPDRVMLSATSAGGGVACNVIASPDALGLVDSVSLQSAGCRGQKLLTDSVPYDSVQPPAVVDHRGLIDQAGCGGAADVLDCLRGLSAETLTQAGEDYADMIGYTPWAPVIDEVVVTADTGDALSNQVIGDVPVIVGATADELDSLFDPDAVPDDQAYRDLLALMFEAPLDDQVYAIYPTADFDSARTAFVTFFNDLTFRCMAEEIARQAASGAPSYLFQISRGIEAGRTADHGIDLAFLFGTFDAYGVIPDDDALSISAAMQHGWSGLATDPTTAPPYLPQGASAWPAYNETDQNYVDFGNTIEVRNAYAAGRCTGLRALVIM